MKMIPSGLPDDRPQFDLSSHFKVIQRESSIKDEDLNDRIQREGAHTWGGDDEASWYWKHKDYAEKLK